ncbi:MAG: CHAD domain-containing protein [Steroidobacteraceae bacterium]
MTDERGTTELMSDADAPAQPPSGEPTALSPTLLEDLRRLLGAWLAHEPGARSGTDPEELHQLRVTARRLDASLGLFKQQLPPPLSRARRTAKSMLRALGATRDLDVQIAGLAAWSAKLSDEERAALAPLQALLAQQRSRAQARMVRVLDSALARRWIETLVDVSTRGTALGNGTADESAALVSQRIRRRFRRLRKAVGRLGARSSMDDYHRVRRRAKQLRYALECGAGLCGGAAQDTLRALRRMQDRLGVQHDAFVANERLNLLAADSSSGLPAATLFIMGRLAESHQRITTAARRTVTKSWRRVRRRWKVLRQRLAELASTSAAPAGVLAAMPAAASGGANGAGPPREGHSFGH